jgi:hypothetical protein
MTAPDVASAQAAVDIAAAPEVVYHLLTDLNTLAELAEEATAMEWKSGGRAQPGAVFTGRNRNGWRRWSTVCTVAAAEPGRAFGFDVTRFGVPVAHWRYDIESTPGGCRVTERTWDQRPGWFKKTAGLVTGISDRDTANAEHIRLTLDRLKARAER